MGPPAGTMHHRFTFHRLGGLDQVALDTGEDLAHSSSETPTPPKKRKAVLGL